MSKYLNNVRISYYQDEILIVQNHHLDTEMKGFSLCIGKDVSKICNLEKLKKFIEENPDYGNIVEDSFFGEITLVLDYELQTNILETFMYLINCCALGDKVTFLKNVNRSFKDGKFVHSVIEHIEIRNVLFFNIKEKVLK